MQQVSYTVDEARKDSTPVHQIAVYKAFVDANPKDKAAMLNWVTKNGMKLLRDAKGSTARVIAIGETLSALNGIINDKSYTAEEIKEVIKAMSKEVEKDTLAYCQELQKLLNGKDNEYIDKEGNIRDKYKVLFEKQGSVVKVTERGKALLGFVLSKVAAEATGGVIQEFESKKLRKKAFLHEQPNMFEIDGSLMANIVSGLQEAESVSQKEIRSRQPSGIS